MNIKSPCHPGISRSCCFHPLRYHDVAVDNYSCNSCTLAALLMNATET